MGLTGGAGLGWGCTGRTEPGGQGSSLSPLALKLVQGEEKMFLLPFLLIKGRAGPPPPSCFFSELSHPLSSFTSALKSELAFLVPLNM